MINLLIHWLMTALVLMLVAYILPGIEISGLQAALIATLVMGIVNVFIKPVLQLLTLPITILTLGLFAFIVNAAMFGLVAWLVPGFSVHGIIPALLGSVVMAVMMAIVGGIKSRMTAV